MIIFDLDTLINEDKSPNYAVTPLLWYTNPYKNRVSIWTGKCISEHDIIKEWLIDHVFLGNFVTFDQIDLKMRPIGNTQPKWQLKEQWLDEITGNSGQLDFIFDCDPESIKMFRNRGLFVFDCRQDK